jgi:hypothetical protein
MNARGKRKLRVAAPAPRRHRAKPDVDHQWFKDRLAEKGLSMRMAARMLGIDQSIVSRRLAATPERRITMGPNDVAELAALLSQPYDEVLRRAGLHTGKPARSAGITGVARPDGIVKPVKPRRVPLPGNELAAMHGVLIDSPAGPWDRAVVFYSPARMVEPEAVGRLAVVGVGNNVMVGVLRHGLERALWDIRGIDGSAIGENVKAAWASPVAWVRL